MVVKNLHFETSRKVKLCKLIFSFINKTDASLLKTMKSNV